MSRAIRARLLAAKDALGRCANDELLQVSKIQALALVDQLGREQIAPDDAASICDMIQSTGFAPVYRKMLIDKVEKGLRAPKKKNRDTQNYTSVLANGTA